MSTKSHTHKRCRTLKEKLSSTRKYAKIYIQRPFFFHSLSFVVKTFLRHVRCFLRPSIIYSSRPLYVVHKSSLANYFGCLLRPFVMSRLPSVRYRLTRLCSMCSPFSPNLAIWPLFAIRCNGGKALNISL